MRLVSKNKSAVLVRTERDAKGRPINIYRRINRDTNKYTADGKTKQKPQTPEQEGSGVQDVQTAQAPVGTEVQTEGQKE